LTDNIQFRLLGIKTHCYFIDTQYFW